jgi:hypothetical protein
MKNQETISSRQIAISTGKKHKNVKKDIERIFKENDPILRIFYLSRIGQKKFIYKLPKKEALKLANTYDVDSYKSIFYNLQDMENSQQNEFQSIKQYTFANTFKVNKKQIAKLNKLATKCSKISQYEIKSIYDDNYGWINTYHVDILKFIFKN